MLGVWRGAPQQVGDSNTVTLRNPKEPGCRSTGRDLHEVEAGADHVEDFHWHSRNLFWMQYVRQAGPPKGVIHCLGHPRQPLLQLRPFQCPLPHHRTVIRHDHLDTQHGACGICAKRPQGQHLGILTGKACLPQPSCPALKVTPRRRMRESSLRVNDEDTALYLTNKAIRNHAHLHIVS